MKILHSGAPMFPRNGGIYAAVRDLSRATQANGITNEVLMPYSAEAEAHLPTWKPVTASSAGTVKIGALCWAPAFQQRVLASDADVLHTHGIWQHPSFVALKWKSRKDRPHIASVHGMLEPWAWQHKAWKKRPVWWLWEQRNLQSASLLHATSEQEAQAFRDRGLTAPIAIIPNGVDLVDAEWSGATWTGVIRAVPVRGSPGGRDQTLNTETLKHGIRTALFLSRVHPKKGLPMLLDAWARVQPEGWNLRIVGPDEGGHRLELERQAANLGLSDKVSFSGPLMGEQRELAFSEADLFVLPTHSENFGIAVAEAMARNLPVITTHGAPWELLETDDCGWWVPVSVDGIAQALDDATRRSPEELVEMGARGRAVVAERFSWEKIAAEMILCYHWVLGKGPKPECVSEV